MIGRCRVGGADDAISISEVRAVFEVDEVSRFPIASGWDIEGIGAAVTPVMVKECDWDDALIAVRSCSESWRLAIHSWAIKVS